MSVKKSLILSINCDFHNKSKSGGPRKKDSICSKMGQWDLKWRWILMKFIKGSNEDNPFSWMMKNVEEQKISF